MLSLAIAISASIMRAASTLNESRLKPQYFTRNRKLPFQKLLKYLLSMHKSSSQSALNNFGYSQFVVGSGFPESAFKATATLDRT